MERRLFVLLAGLSILVGTGCPERKFKVEMVRTPDGQIHRTLTVWTQEDGDITGPAEDVLAVAQQAYGTSGGEARKRMRFEGMFACALPADLVHETLMNDGFVSRVTTQLGAVETYIERMPGEADPVKLLRAAERATDTVARAMSAGLGQVPELAAEPERLKGVQRFLSTQFKEDFMGALLLGWQIVARLDCAHQWGKPQGIGGSVPEPYLTAETVRFVSFAAEHGYLDRNALILDEDDLSRAIVVGFMRRVAAEAGYPGNKPLPEYWTVMFSLDGISKVFENGMTEIGVSEDEFSKMCETMMPALFGNNTSGQVIFESVSEPIRTNGDYDAEQRRLTWDCWAHRGCEPPQIVFSLWASPDEAWQTEHLGSVMCGGDALNDYIVWWVGLDAKQRTEWDAFVATLKPVDAAERLRAFRFAGAEETKKAEKGEGEFAETGEEEIEDVTRGASLILGL